LISAMRGPEEQREFRLRWSLFRRAHQAVAKRSHEANHSKKHAATIAHMHLIERDGHRRADGPDSTRPSESGTPKMAVHLKRALLFWPTPSGSALECYCRSRSRAWGVPDAMTDRCFAGYCGSWTPALRGEIYQRRSLGPTAQFTVGTASGAKKGSGLG
jgi:hypothetical protein